MIYAGVHFFETVFDGLSANWSDTSTSAELINTMLA